MWHIGDDPLCKMHCINPQFTTRHDNIKVAYHGRTLSKMEWIYTCTKVRGQVSLALEISCNYFVCSIIIDSRDGLDMPHYVIYYKKANILKQMNF